MKKGEIYMAQDKGKHPHPIVYLENLSNNKFKACILSTKGILDNVKMSESHFEKQDDNGRSYKIQYKNSHLVPNRVFEKNECWLDSTQPQGKLTEEGIEFAEKFTKGCELEYHPLPIYEEKNK